MQASGLRTGDQVCALLAGGGYAQYCVAPALHCLPVPQGLNLVGWGDTSHLDGSRDEIHS